MGRTAPDPQHTYTHEFQKKLTHNSTGGHATPDINIRVNNYEYSNGSTMEAPKIPGQNVPLLLPRSISSEHHYDEPQFASRLVDWIIDLIKFDKTASKLHKVSIDLLKNIQMNQYKWQIEG